MEGTAPTERGRERPVDAVVHILRSTGVSRFGVAVSGGSDSMALLLAARSVLDRDAGKSAACLHVDHGLRDDSGSDRRFVHARAVAHGLRFESRKVVPTRRTPGASFEGAAREARYDALVDMARSLELEAVLLAHHEDDRIETTALNLLRGSGVRGLKGLVAERLFDRSPNVKFLRPFLAFPKSELADFVASSGEEFVFDSTNDDTTMRRNRLRKHCLDPRKADNAAMRERLLRMAEIADELDRRAEIAAADWIDRRVVIEKKCATVARNDLLRLSPTFGHVVVRAIIERLDQGRFVLKERRFADFLRGLRIPEAAFAGDWGDGVRVRLAGEKVLFERDDV